MGQQLADAVGVTEPPVSLEESSRQVLEQVCMVNNLLTSINNDCVTN